MARCITHQQMKIESAPALNERWVENILPAARCSLAPSFQKEAASQICVIHLLINISIAYRHHDPASVRRRVMGFRT